MRSFSCTENATPFLVAGTPEQQSNQNVARSGNGRRKCSGQQRLRANDETGAQALEEKKPPRLMGRGDVAVMGHFLKRLSTLLPSAQASTTTPSSEGHIKLSSNSKTCIGRRQREVGASQWNSLRRGGSSAEIKKPPRRRACAPWRKGLLHQRESARFGIGRTVVTFASSTGQFQLRTVCIRACL